MTNSLRYLESLSYKNGKSILSCFLSATALLRRYSRHSPNVKPTSYVCLDLLLKHESTFSENDLAYDRFFLQNNCGGCYELIRLYNGSELSTKQQRSSIRCRNCSLNSANKSRQRFFQVTNLLLIKGIKNICFNDRNMFSKRSCYVL